MSEEKHRELLTELDNEWHVLKHGNPVPGLYVQSGAETVKVRGNSTVIGESIVTRYEIVVLDGGKVVGSFRVSAEEDRAAVEETLEE